MERIAIARAGARHEAAARAARPTSFCLAAEPLYEDPGRGDFSVSNFHPDPGNPGGSLEATRRLFCTVVGTQASPRRQIGGPARGVAQPGWECL